MKKLNLLAGVIVMMASGCISNYVMWVEGPVPEKDKSLAANCTFTSSGGQAEENGVYKGLRNLPISTDSSVAGGVVKNLNAVHRPKGFPILVNCSIKEGSSTSDCGVVAGINNVISACTLGIWPFVNAKTKDYTISLNAYGQSVEKKVRVGWRSWSSFIVPFGALPCPGFGDMRSGVGVSNDKPGGEAEGWRNEILAGHVVAMLSAPENKDFLITAENTVKEGVKLLNAALESEADAAK